VRTVSVVVPTYNRPERLRACLGALAALRYPRTAYEVVVVDDGSAEPLDGVVAPFRERMDLTLVRQENAGPAAARNAGAEAARYEYLAFTDDDCAPDSGWLRALAMALEETPSALVGGHTVNVLDNTYAEVSQRLVDFLYAYYGDRAGPGAFFTSNNMAVDRGRFLETGGFSTAFPLAAGEDREYCYRWARGRKPLRHVPEAVVRHAHAMTLRSFLRQHVNYGRGAWVFHRIRARSEGGSMQPEPLSFYLRLVTDPLRAPRRTPLPNAVAQTGLLACTQVANVAGYFIEAARRRAGMRGDG
jgi:glycosyltransferase involved in cell wall biosynthesis